MSKHTSTFLLLMVISVGVCSCSSLSRFGQTKSFLYKTVKVNNDESILTNKEQILYVTNSKESCFSDNSGDIITVQADYLKQAINYFYKNKATWDIQITKTANSNKLQMQASSPAQIEYEVAYCTFEYGGLFKESYDYASFRLVNSGNP